MTDFIPAEVFDDILRFLRRENRLALRWMMNYGMRIGDCLSLRIKDILPVWQGKTDWVTYTEQKTGKERSFTPSAQDMAELWCTMDPESPWCFPGRDPQKHRTRQAVWKDLHQVAALYRVDGKKLCRKLGTHTARKIYAVGMYRDAKAKNMENPLDIVRVDLNHRDLSVTFLYALADIITSSRVGEKM